MTETRNICVTGGAGFIGSHLVEALVRDGHSVTVVDDFSMGRPENLQTVEDNISLIKRSIMDFSTLLEALKGVDLVFHLAALLGVQRVYDRPLDIIDSSVMGTRNVFQACVERSIPRVVYASSSEVYGDSRKIPYSEDDSTSPISCYAVSKLLGEKIAEACQIAHGVDYTCLRLFNTYGPRQDSSEYGFVVARFLERTMDRRPPIIHGDGSQTRDFTYVDDTVRCTKLASGKKGINQIINVGSGIETPIIDVAKTMIRISGNNLGLEFAPRRPDDILRRQADMQKARRLLGFEPQVTLENGLRKTLRHYLIANGHSSESVLEVSAQ